VTDLARLSLEQPVFVSVHENASHTTPDTLTQSYIVTDLQHKVNSSRKNTYV
jgi:ATP-dependent RNA helicase DDX10/DBP4